jgi:pimeloyl-ACP methyl ester carboxylesterase
MKRRAFVTGVAASGVALVTPTVVNAQTTNATPEGAEMTQTSVETGYAPVNGLQMYYEIHGSGGVPIVLLHGAYMNIGSMSALLTELVKNRQVIAVDFQGHGRTADIDRPIEYELLTDDVAALMDHLGIAQADLVGYSVGGGVALRLASKRPDLVRKVVSASSHYRLDGMYPEVLATITEITAEAMMGTIWYEEYARVAPNPEEFPVVVEKLKTLDAVEFAFPEEDMQAIAAPTLLISGDADVIQPEHTLTLFRLLGGGVPGDLTGLPKARLAVLPSTTHITMMERIPWLMPMIEEFLAEPMPDAA